MQAYAAADRPPQGLLRRARAASRRVDGVGTPDEVIEAAMQAALRQREATPAHERGAQERARRSTRMRDAGRIVAEILDALEKAVAPGVTTWELDQLAERLIHEKGAKPAFKGYRGFPACLCTSINQEVVHGIPSQERTLVEGDLVKLDFGVVYEGFYGDSARTVPVGEGLPRRPSALSEATRRVAGGGHRQRSGPATASATSATRSRPTSEAKGFMRWCATSSGTASAGSSTRRPRCPTTGRQGTGMQLRPGMVLAIEPMVNAGTPEVDVLDDDWTAVTLDGRLSAHWEHTILVTETGPEVLTRPAARTMA